MFKLPVDFIVNHCHRYRHPTSFHRCKCLSGIIIVIEIIDVLAVTENIDVVGATGRYQRRPGYVCVGDKVVLFIGVVVSTSSVVAIVDVVHRHS